ncbi:hypothetical protein FB45DRAFT_1067725 [Roridomyces roridus]|uniref:MYND-type domain-containing protein n=1 Tax=Roridomyces roridus TaxID=1738132 RepID=A0AAD7B1E4_9AGAR|nr:hypothetical protein FB45DRAFT_1067725 [Roridomyces roridus]
MSNCVKRAASLAMADTRTLGQVQHARELIETPTLCSSQRLAFLAVFFPVLDPTRIPRLEELSTTALQDIASADVALDAMFHLRTQGEIGLSLWPRLGQKKFYVDFTLFAGAYHDHPATYALMSGTPGFGACIVKAWTFLAPLNDPNERYIMLNDLSGFLADSGVRSHPERLEEMIDAAGSIDIFAALVVEYIRTVRKHSRLPVEHIQRLMFFIDEADQFPEDRVHDWMLVPLGSLSLGLYTCSDGAEELVATALFLCERQEPETGSVIDDCLVLVRRMVIISPATLWLGELLDCGLLRLLVLITLRGQARRWKIKHHVRFFLTLLLPADLLSGEDLKKTVLYDLWRTFLASAEERVEALVDYKSLYEAQKACDNQECAVIEEASSLKRCSGCQAFYYCSVDCQRNDWELGHRNACGTNNALLLSARAELVFSERSFLRALIHHKYLKERHSICEQQIRVLSEYDIDVRIPFTLFTLFDYCKSPPVITVYPVDPEDAETQTRLNEVVETESEEWEDVLERAMVGEGCYQLHGMRLLEGPKMRTWVVPLRTDGNDVFAAVISLSQKMRRGVLSEDSLHGEIEDLLESEEDMVEIH